MDEAIERYYHRFGGNPTFQQILGIVQSVLPTQGFYGLVMPPTDQQVELTVRIFMMLENAIGWNTTCINCARMLDRSIADYERAERAEEKISMIRALLDLE